MCYEASRGPADLCCVYNCDIFPSACKGPAARDPLWSVCVKAALEARERSAVGVMKAVVVARDVNMQGDHYLATAAT